LRIQIYILIGVSQKWKKNKKKSFSINYRDVSSDLQCSSTFIPIRFLRDFPARSLEFQHCAGFSVAHVPNRTLACATPPGNRIYDFMPRYNFSHIAKACNLPRRRARQLDFAGNRLGIIFPYRLSAIPQYRSYRRTIVLSAKYRHITRDKRKVTCAVNYGDFAYSAGSIFS